jgi:hypothetical protein
VVRGDASFSIGYHDTIALNVSSSSSPTGSGGFGQLAGVYAIDQNGAPNSIGDATAAGFRCVK